MPRDDMCQALWRIAAIIRGAGDALQRQYGPAALELLYKAMDDAQRVIDESLGNANP